MVSARSFAFSAAVAAAALVGTVDAHWAANPYVYQVARDDAECRDHPNITRSGVDAPAAFIDVVNLSIGQKANVNVNGVTTDRDIEVKTHRQVFPIPATNMKEDGYAGLTIGDHIIIACFGDTSGVTGSALMCNDLNPVKASSKLAAGKSILYQASDSVVKPFGHVVQEKGDCVAGGALSKGVGLMTLMTAAAAMVFN